MWIFCFQLLFRVYSELLLRRKETRFFDLEDSTQFLVTLWPNWKLELGYTRVLLFLWVFLTYVTYEYYILFINYQIIGKKIGTSSLGQSVILLFDSRCDKLRL